MGAPPERARCQFADVKTCGHKTVNPPYGFVIGRIFAYCFDVVASKAPFDEGKRSAVAVVNDSPVDCQSRDRIARRQLSAKLTGGEKKRCAATNFSPSDKSRCDCHRQSFYFDSLRGAPPLWGTSLITSARRRCACEQPPEGRLLASRRGRPDAPAPMQQYDKLQFERRLAARLFHTCGFLEFCSEKPKKQQNKWEIYPLLELTLAEKTTIL